MKKDAKKWMVDVLATRKLAIVEEIDRIRDTIHDPKVMREAIAGTLIAEFKSTNSVIGCIIGIADPQNGGKLVVDTAIGDGLKKYNEIRIYNLMMSVEEHLLRKKSKESVGVIIPPNHIMAVLLRIEGEVLGIVILIGLYAFDENDLKVLEATGRQIDSAIVQGRRFYELEEKNKSLEEKCKELEQEKNIVSTMRKIDKIRDQHLPFDEMISKVAHEIGAIIPGEAAIMIYDRKKEVLNLSATTNSYMLINGPNRGILLNNAEAALKDAELKNWSGEQFQVQSIICLPLIIGDQKLGVIAAINREGASRFTKEDEGLLQAIGDMLDTAIFEGMDKDLIKRALGRSVGDSVMEKMLQAPHAGLVKAKRRTVTALEVDIRGFTTLSEKISPSLLARFLNDYLGTMARVAIDCGGTIDKFIGDAVLVLFNAPNAQRDHAILAVQTSIKMQEAYVELLKRWAKYSIKNPIGIGISTGTPVVGEFGCELRTDYTGLGKSINHCSRICGSAQGGQTLLWPSTYELVKERVKVEIIDGCTFKGIGDLITAYRVIELIDKKKK